MTTAWQTIVLCVWLLSQALGFALPALPCGDGQASHESFGEPIRATGSVAFLNPFRFSTKYCDDETGHYYYGYRYYSPTQGRWLSRDPLNESGGLHLYAFCGNDPLDRMDPLGLRVPRTPEEAAAAIEVWNQLSQAALEMLWRAAEDFGCRQSQAFWHKYEAYSAAADVTLAEVFTYFQARAAGNYDEQGRVLLPAYWADEGTYKNGEQPGDLPGTIVTSLTGPPLTVHEARFLYDPESRCLSPVTNPNRSTEPQLSPLDFGPGFFSKGAALKAGMVTGVQAVGKGGLISSAMQRVRTLAESCAKKQGGNVSKSGGRLGSELTRRHIADVAAELESRGWTITGGGGRLPEEYLAGPGGGRLGSSFPDITATKNGRTLRINTVETYADGVTPTAREAANAARIRSQTPGDHLLLVPKPKPRRIQ